MPRKATSAAKTAPAGSLSRHPDVPVRPQGAHTHCGRCSRAFDAPASSGIVVDGDTNEDDGGGGGGGPSSTSAKRKRSGHPCKIDADGGAICSACYQKEYYENSKSGKIKNGPCALCGAERTTGYWHKSHAETTKGKKVCQNCYMTEKRARDVKNPAKGLNGAVKCANCSKATPGSAFDYWYRSQRGSIAGDRICKACHTVERRDRLNDDPDVFCVMCKMDKLKTGGWRKHKDGGHCCDKCYKTARLQAMNDDPSVRCHTCGSESSGPPEWRKDANGAWLCRTCMSHQRSLQKKNKASLAL